MKENEKLVSRARALSSREKKGVVEVGETSFRVYYGETGAAVPFMWESQPGTPKHPIFNKSNDNIVPPLTPPPSYNSSSTTASVTSSRRNRRPRILLAFLSSISRRTRSHVTPTPALSSSSYSGPLSWSTSSSNSSSLSISSPRHCASRIKHRAQRRSLLLCSSPKVKKFPLFDDDTEEDESDSPTTSTIMCFGFKKQGCYSVKGINNAIFDH